MSKNWLLRGDCHGNFVWLDNLDKEQYAPEDTNIIILGDVGLNFFLTKTDEKMKSIVNSKGYRLYCLRGNHEARPTALKAIATYFDDDVQQYVLMEPQYSNIRYLLDGYVYHFGNYRCLCIGGAYSVDKWYRLARANCTETFNDPKKTGWFADEQLTVDEMARIFHQMRDVEVDFVFTHTCPLRWQPTDLFLGFVDQSQVDATMERWLNELVDEISYKIWCFGHYHKDRIERPHVEQYFNDIEELDIIYERWNRYDKTGELDWWLNKSPNFYMR